MAASPTEAWPVARMAAVSGVSPAHFSRRFRAAFGVPPHRYLLTLRLGRAKALLRDTDLPITDVALASGWRSLGTFSRTFRDVVGASPSAHRRAARPAAAVLAGVPACVLAAATRPHLTTAVSEKRRRDAPE